MVRRIKFALLGLAVLVLLPTTVAPAMAAGPSNPPAPPSPTVTSGTLAQLQLLIADLPPPTAEQLATAQAFMAKHPLHGTVGLQASATSPVTPISTANRYVKPLVSVGVSWWGIYMHFTQGDVHNIWDLVWAAGVGAAATILCSPGLLLAVVCAIGGAVVAYIVAEVIWNYIGYYVPSCGVHIGYYWYGAWYWGRC
jgi:hypothetical protein